MKKVIVMICSVFILLTTANAATFEVEINRGTKEDHFAYNKILEVNDGIVLAGSIPDCHEAVCAFGKPFNGGWNDAAVAKYKKDGSLAWSFVLKGNGEEELKEIFKIDGGYIVAGYVASSDLSAHGISGYGQKDALIFRLDENGNLVWIKLFGGTDYDDPYNFILKDDGVIMNGFTGSGSELGLSTDTFSVKYDFDGNQIWLEDHNPTLHGPYAKDTIDGFKYESERCDLYYEDIINCFTAKLDKVDENGNVLWSFSFGKNGVTYFTKVVKVDGGYLIYADSYSDLTDYGFPEIQVGDVTALIIKLDDNGNHLWTKYLVNAQTEKFMGRPNMPQHKVFNDIVEVSDGYLISTYMINDMPEYGLSLIGNSDALLIKLDKNGNVLWMKNNAHADEYGDYEDYVYESIVVIGDYYAVVGVETGYEVKFNVEIYDKNGNFIEVFRFNAEDILGNQISINFPNLVFNNYSNGMMTVMMSYGVADGNRPGLYVANWKIKQLSTPPPGPDPIPDPEEEIIENPPTGLNLGEGIFISSFALVILVGTMIGVKKVKHDIKKSDF